MIDNSKWRLRRLNREYSFPLQKLAYRTGEQGRSPEAATLTWMLPKAGALSKPASETESEAVLSEGLLGYLCVLTKVTGSKG